MGNIYAKIFSAVNQYVLGRRGDTRGVNRSRADHPERLPPNQTPSPTETKAKTISTDSTLETEFVATSEECSDFYLASRNNKVEEVIRFLESISQDEIDRIEPNGSTALHAAAYHGHVDIVRLLLDRGADRAIQNKFQCLPFDEASNDQIKELFLRIPNSNRLITNTGAIEWELVDDDALEKAMEERQIIETIYKSIPLERMFEKIEKTYIEKGLANLEKISTIKHFFEKATKEKDPTWIIKAYTAETDFYNVLNAEIAGGANKYQSERRYIIALLMHHPKLDSLSFRGMSFRVMQVNEHHLNKYQIDKLSMTKAFLSSSIDEKIAAWFLSRHQSVQENNGIRTRHKNDGTQPKIWIMAKYLIKHRRTALHIENSSQYTAEGEVLIMPYTVFKVKNKKTVTPSYLPEGKTIVEIEFEECDQYIHT